MDADFIVHSAAMIDLGISLLADRSDGYGKPLRPRGIEQEERETTVAGYETELHGYLIIPRWLRSMKSATTLASSLSSARIFSTAWDVFIREASSSRKAFCSTLSRSGENPRRTSPTLLMPNARFSRFDDVSENGRTSWVTMVPPPMNAYWPTVQNW